MSYIHLLFPPREPGIPDQASHEAALSTRRIRPEESQAAWRNSELPSKRRCTSHSHQRNLHGFPEHIAPWRTKYLLSKTESRTPRDHGPYTRRNFREPTVPRHRGYQYSISPSYWSESQPQGSTPHSVGESTSSPRTVNADWDSPSSPDGSVDVPSTPGSVCDQFRSGPFGHIFDGLRLTDQERDLLEELAQPDATESAGQKRRAPTAAEIVQTLSQMTYFDFINQSPNAGASPGGQMDNDQPSDAAEPVPVGDDDEGAERDRQRDNSTHDEKEPSMMHQRTVPDADDNTSEKDQTPGTG